ncbi:BTB/POZ domain protein [Indivirus ILV1]|uniref:BTB/POZ domain protein n=1 Tax=Indivirus ILV1 TaxID=1977633 RepID=A0A1V0SCP0_9VIRU|nr:BTB/POZ domain protein [Indivirus ILV1]
MELVTFLADDRKFVLQKDTFNDFPNSLLTQVVNGETTDKTIYVDPLQKNLFYVNRNPKSFGYIIDHLRGYDIDLDNINDKNLREKVLHDLKYYNLDFKIINLNIESNIPNDVFGKDNLVDMLNSTNEEYDRKNTHLLNKLQEVLEKQYCNLENQTFNIDNGSISQDLINDLSNNEDIKKLIIQSQIDQMSDSDTDSLDFNEDRYIEIN